MVLKSFERCDQCTERTQLQCEAARLATAVEMEEKTKEHYYDLLLLATRCGIANVMASELMKLGCAFSRHDLYIQLLEEYPLEPPGESSPSQ